MLSAIDLYFLLVVYSYYQVLMMSATMVAVALPVVSYTAPGLDTVNDIYAQPAANPYLFDAKISRFQPNEPYPPPVSYQYYGSPYTGSEHPAMAPLPPPYRP